MALRGRSSSDAGWYDCLVVGGEHHRDLWSHPIPQPFSARSVIRFNCRPHERPSARLSRYAHNKLKTRWRSAASSQVFLFAISVPAGCSSPTRLADFPDPELTVRLSQEHREVIVKIVPRRDVLPESESPCKLRAPKARATLNGVALTRQTGRREGNDRFYDLDCLVQFSAPGGAIPVTGNGATLVVEDGSTTWTFQIPEALTPRRLTIVSPADGIIRRGQDVAMQWSPASDRIGEVEFELYGGELQPGKGMVIHQVAARGDGRLVFTLPATIPSGLHGGAWLQLRGPAQVAPASGPCPVGSCSVSLWSSVPPVPMKLED